MLAAYQGDERFLALELSYVGRGDYRAAGGEVLIEAGGAAGIDRFAEAVGKDGDIEGARELLQRGIGLRAGKTDAAAVGEESGAGAALAGWEMRMEAGPTKAQENSGVRATVDWSNSQSRLPARLPMIPATGRLNPRRAGGRSSTEAENVWRILAARVALGRTWIFWGSHAARSTK
jgi:hypothetical protein